MPPGLVNYPTQKVHVHEPGESRGGGPTPARAYTYGPADASRRTIPTNGSSTDSEATMNLLSSADFWLFGVVIPLVGIVVACGLGLGALYAVVRVVRAAWKG